MMSGKRSSMMIWETCVKVFIFVGLLLISSSSAATNFADVAAINSLYAALGSPSIPGWLASAGDPCGESWQGVQCNDTDILSITLGSENLGGELGNALGTFSSITKIDFSNNNIGGSIPANLPVTLLNLDLSHNNFSGELPSSMKDLPSLTTLHLQNNQLSGTLDVLQDLPLIDLNVENNLFNGQIPDKMLGIPNFKKDGNQFNATLASSPPSGSPTTPPPLPASTRPPFSDLTPGRPSSGSTPGRPSSGSTPGRPSSGSTPAKPATRAPPPEKAISETTKKNSKTKRVVWISILSVFVAIVLLLALLLFVPRCHRRRRESDRTAKQHEVAPYVGGRDNSMLGATLVSRPNSQSEKEDPKMAVARPKEEIQKEPRKVGWTPNPRNEPERDVQKLSALPKRDDHKIDLSRFDIDSLMPPPPPPPPPPHVDKLFVNPVISTSGTAERHSTNVSLPPTPVKSFTIAALQQYTNSFSQENLIGAGMLGTVYRAELPNGKLLAVKKLDKRVSSQQKDEDFIGLVNNIDTIRHAHVVELMGYCAEHGQRLLVYEYCSNGTLQDALHSDDDFKKKLSWNARMRMALGAARALEYLHEICEPPIIHRNFKSANVLLDDELAVHISDCGLSTLITSGSVSQLSGHLLTAYGYGAPEFESGIYTSKSDVFSFGVVMLELLTGRKSYDRSRNRGEQFLVRWAIQQLHDIEALSSMVDPSLNGEYPIKALSRFADVISRCVQGEPEFRPPMSEVVQDLLQIIRRESPPRTGED